VSVDGRIAASIQISASIGSETGVRLGWSHGKKVGRQKNLEWQSTQTLWWNGVAYEREGEEYQKLLDRAFDALAKNVHWRIALLSTGDQLLTHSMGNADPKRTVLTEEEFCSRLMNIRARLLK